MATSSSPYMSTEETTNANRTSRLILGPCTDELRDVLRHFVPPQTFPHVIKQKANTSSLSRLTGPQMNLISPRNGTYTGNYEDMDISLLYALLRNICGIPPHSKGWGNDPDPTDCSPSACIETIRLARNRCVHSCIPSLSNIEFSHIWSTVRAAVVNLDNFLKNGCKYEREVDFLRHETMDPVRDQHYQEELRKQVEEDLETREMLTNFKRKYEEDAEIVEKKVKRLEEEIECPVPQNIKALHNLDLKKWEEEDTFYQETHSFSSMMQKVKDQPYVIFVGVPGSGKSATARHIALKLKSENYQVLPIKDIRKLEDFCDTNNPQVFVMEDALGVYGLQQSELNIILRYKERIITPMNENSKLLLTCREIVFNEVLCHNVFLAEDNNVIKLCNSEHDLNDNDKKLILKKYGLDEDLMTRSELRSASRMFPLLCKLFAKDLKLRSLGSKFFIMPVQCFLEELDKMRSENKINYATLILCMMNGDMLSKEILRDKNNAEFIEMKTVVLESCRVESHTDTFKFMDALSAMKGTYTRENDTVFSFIHDYIYEICAFHYGQQFLDQVLLYLDSCYIANYVRPKDVEASTSSTGEKSFDLCLRLNEGQYLMFAERLYRDIQDLDLHDVFMNNSLKHPQVIQAFINVLERKSYTELKSIFLQKQGRGLPHLLSKVRDLIKETQMQTNEEIERERQCVLLDEKWHAKTYTHNIRVISWVIMYGHNQILQYILKEVKKHDEDIKREVFMDTQISEHPQSKREVFHDKIINDITGSLNATKLLLLNCRYIEQTRLLVLACYSGDVETVKAILPHMNRNSLNSICLSNAHTPLVIACQGGFKDIVKELINAGADISQQDLHGNAPLVTACQGGNLSVMKKLVSVGVDVNQPDGRGRRPIVAACQGGHLSLVQELVKAKADVNLRNGQQEVTTGEKGQRKWILTTKLDKEMYTPLVAASKGGDVRLIEELVKAGADVNLQDGEGNTPSVSACKEGHLSVVEKLVKAGADVHLCDGKGNTALVLACEAENVGLVAGHDI